jgi:hypothetical protein
VSDPHLKQIEASLRDIRQIHPKARRPAAARRPSALSITRGINIEVSATDRERLAAVGADRNGRQKHVWRARIILATAEGRGTVNRGH